MFVSYIILVMILIVAETKRKRGQAQESDLGKKTRRKVQSKTWHKWLLLLALHAAKFFVCLEKPKNWLQQSHSCMSAVICAAITYYTSFGCYGDKIVAITVSELISKIGLQFNSPLVVVPNITEMPTL